MNSQAEGNPGHHPELMRDSYCQGRAPGCPGADATTCQRTLPQISTWVLGTRVLLAWPRPPLLSGRWLPVWGSLGTLSHYPIPGMEPHTCQQMEILLPPSHIPFLSNALHGCLVRPPTHALNAPLWTAHSRGASLRSAMQECRDTALEMNESVKEWDGRDGWVGHHTIPLPVLSEQET